MGVQDLHGYSGACNRKTDVGHIGGEPTVCFENAPFGVRIVCYLRPCLIGHLRGMYSDGIWVQVDAVNDE